jgi:hypothetical protein
MPRLVREGRMRRGLRGLGMGRLVGSKRIVQRLRTARSNGDMHTVWPRIDLPRAR